MKGAGLVLAALLALQDPTPSPPPGQQTTVDFGPLHVFDGNDLVAVMRGASADYNTRLQSGTVRQGRLIYYTDPVGSDVKSSRQVVLDFALARVDNLKKRYSLSDGVEIVMDDGTHIATRSVDVDHARQLIRCPERVRMLHFGMDGPLDWIRFLAGPTPDAELSGASLDIDNAGRTYTVSKDATLILKGRPEDLVPGHPRGPRAPQSMELRSAGPMEIKDFARELPGGWRILRITASADVRMSRTDANGTVAVRADHAVFYVARVAQGPRTETIPIAAACRGKILIEDSRGMKVACERLDWNHRDDVLRLEGSPRVDLEQGGHRLHAQAVVVDRWTRRIRFLGDIAASLKTEEGKPPLDVIATDLELECLDFGSTWKPAVLRAWNGVKLTGSWGTAGGGALRADAEEFVWDAVERRATLRGRPNASVEQGGHLAVAPLIVFEGFGGAGGSLMVVKGPKVIRFTHAGQGGERLKVHVTGDGDVEYDSTAGRVKLVDRHLVRTEDSTLVADVLHLQMSPDGDAVETIRGFGRVELSRAAGPGGSAVHLAGEAVVYRPVEHVVEVHGLTRATMRLGGLGELTGRTIRYHERTREAEVVGGRGTGRLLIDEGGLRR